MNGKIEEYGNLCIERAGVMKEQWCPYTVSGKDMTKCGDWCSHFGEPFEGDEHDKKHGINQCLTLCHTLLEFNEFSDERNL